MWWIILIIGVLIVGAMLDSTLGKIIIGTGVIGMGFFGFGMDYRFCTVYGIGKNMYDYYSNSYCISNFNESS